MLSLTKLANTRVLIIGGSSGIGFAVARLALEHGASVLIASSSSPRVDAAVSRLQTLYPDEPFSGRIAGTTCDLGDESTVEQNLVNLLEHATQPTLFAPSPSSSSSSTSTTIPKLNHIVMTAGDTFAVRPVSDPAFTLDYIHAALAVRFTASLFLAKHLPRFMDISPRSSLTFTSGVNTARPSPGWTMLAAMGGAVEAMGRGLAVDMAPVRVNTVAPGAVRTELFERMTGAQLESAERSASEKSLVGEMGRPEDVAEAYLWLMKDGFVTGEVVGSNGGRLLK